MAGILLPLALVLVSRGIEASALPMPLACLPGAHILATISQSALPCAYKILYHICGMKCGTVVCQV